MLQDNQGTFKALLLEQHEGQVIASIQQLQLDALPPGEVLVEVAYSSLNYKDALAVTNTGKIVREFPIVPGIDLAGRVLESASPMYQTGDEVLVTGWGIGERYWGGYTQRQRVRAEWLVPVPQGLSLKQAMGIGTAGFTAMLGVMALEQNGLTPSDPHEVIVSGASGGVGSVAIAVLAQLGYNVVASTGRASSSEYLRTLGARSIIDRQELAGPSKRPLESERWAGAIDTVGGETLAAIIRSVATGGSVAACGLVGGVALNTTVFPFILRGVNLLGIDSVMCPHDRRRAAWGRLLRDLPLNRLDDTIQVVPLAEVPALSAAMINGQTRGRIVIDLNA
jgi:acrylyl-CoA reductase (NADPH)